MTETSPYLRTIRRKGAKLILAERDQPFTNRRKADIIREREITSQGTVAGANEVDDYVAPAGVKRKQLLVQFEKARENEQNLRDGQPLSKGIIGKHIQKLRNITAQQDQLGMRKHSKWLGQDGKAQKLLVQKLLTEDKRIAIVEGRRQEAGLSLQEKRRRMRIRQVGLVEVERREQIVRDNERAKKLDLERRVRKNYQLELEKAAADGAERSGTDPAVQIENEVLTSRVQRAEEIRLATAANERIRKRTRSARKTAAFNSWHGKKMVRLQAEQRRKAEVAAGAYPFINNSSDAQKPDISLQA